MSVKPGDIITMSSFNHVQPTLKAGFKAPHGRLAVFLLLGDVDKKAPESFDPGSALRMLGWYPESDFGPTEPSTGSLEDRAAELAASMKVMAALHRANEDVAAADEFAKGAALVLELATEAERYRFIRATFCDDSFGEQVQDFLDDAAEVNNPTEAMMDERIDAGLNLARQSGIWPRPGNPANQEDDSACWTVPK